MKNEIVISAKNLVSGYKDKVVWEDASFEVRAGEFIVLLGPNGAGKTTLFKLILGLIKPQAGLIEVFGKIPSKGSSSISYFPQKRFIDNDLKLNCIEYVKLVLSGNKLGFSLPKVAKQEEKIALEALKMVDGLKFANKPLSQLSGGEQQKIFLAQAIVQRPKILLLDEPLANLDIKREGELIELIKSVSKKNNMTVILIAHDVNPLLPVIDRIIYIANKKVASGLPSEIITSKKLTELYGSNVEVLKSQSGRIAVLGMEGGTNHEH